MPTITDRNDSSPRASAPTGESAAGAGARRENGNRNGNVSGRSPHRFSNRDAQKDSHRASEKNSNNDEGSDSHQGPTLEVVGWGRPRLLGKLIGKKLHRSIHDALKLVARLDAFQRQRPWWVPTPMFRLVSGWQAEKIIRPGLQRFLPDLDDRLKGMAEGASIDLGSLCLFHMLESCPDPMEDDRVRVPAVAGCSAVALRPEQVASNEPVLAHNLDMFPESRALLTLRRLDGPDRLRSLQFTYAPLGGTVDGINEAGLAVTYNFVAARDVDPSRPPVSCVIDEVLARCRTVDAAVSLLRKIPRAGGALLMLADSRGHVAAMEISGTRTAVRRPRRDGSPLAHTNDYVSEAMRRHEPPRSAVYASQCHPALRGRRVYESPERRRHTLNESLRRKGQFSTDRIAAMMASHGPHGRGDANTVCMHGDYWSTIATLQLLPGSRRMRIAYGPACEAKPVEFVV